MLLVWLSIYYWIYVKKEVEDVVCVGVYEDTSMRVSVYRRPEIGLAFERKNRKVKYVHIVEDLSLDS